MKKVLITLAIAAAATAAQAEGVYLGADVTHNVAKDFCNDVPSRISCDDTDYRYRLSVGYDFNQYLGLEVGYNSLGRYSVSSAVANGSVDGNAADVSVLGHLPLNDQFSLYGKAGVAAWKVDGSVDAGGLNIYSGSDKGSSGLIGLGAEYKMDALSFTVGATRIFDVSGSDIDQYGVGIKYHL